MNKNKIFRLLTHYWFLSAVFIVLSILSYPRAIKLMSNISTDISKLLPDDHPTVALGQEMKQKFKKKGGGDLVVIIDSPNPENNKKLMLDLVQKFQSEPFIVNVLYTKEGFDFFADHKLLYIDTDDLVEIKDRISRKIQREKLKGLYIDFGSDNTSQDPLKFEDMFEKYRAEYIRGVKNKYFTNENETVYVLKLYPKNQDASLSYYKKFYGMVDNIIRAYPVSSYGDAMRISYAGSIRTRIDEYNTLISDLTRAGIISLICIALSLFIYFQNIASVILVFIPLVLGILGGFSVCSFFISNLNVVTSFLFSILFGLGVDIGIHMLDRYQMERVAGIDQKTAISHIIFKTGRSSSIAVLTTVGTFFILVFNDFRGFSEFGWIAGIGLLITLISYLLFFPALIILFEKLRLIKNKPKKIWGRLALTRFFEKIPAYKGIVISCICLFIISLFLFPYIGFEWNYRMLKMHVPETEEARARLREVSGRVNSPAFIVIHNEDEALKLSREFKKRKKDPASIIDTYRSVYDLYPRDQKEKMAILKEIDRLFSDDALNVLKGKDRQLKIDFQQAIRNTKFVKEAEIPETIKEAFYGLGEYKNEQVSFIYPKPNLELDDGRNAIRFFKEAHELDVEGQTFHASSDAMIFADVLLTLFRDSRVTMIFSFLIVGLLVYLDFMNYKRALVVMLVLSFGMCTMVATMVLFGWEFNFYNMIAIPVVLGMGEDNSVHIYHRYLEKKQTSVVEALSSTGSAAFMASLTTLFGYLGLSFCHHPGLRSIGNSVLIGLVTCLVASLILLPALLEWGKERKNI